MDDGRSVGGTDPGGVTISEFFFFFFLVLTSFSVCATIQEIPMLFVFFSVGLTSNNFPSFYPGPKVHNSLTTELINWSFRSSFKRALKAFTSLTTISILI